MKVSKLTLVMPKPKVVVGAILIALMLLSLGLMPPSFAESTETTFHNVTVDSAYDMVTSGSALIILDVRPQHEYDRGHLYDAFLIPCDELEKRTDELEEYKDHEVLVYCRSGYRSQIACEILVEHDFAKVYNMLGGILAWIDAGYPIWTTHHHVTVNVLDRRVLLQIEPLLQDGCESCTCNQGIPSGSEPQNIQTTVLEEKEGYRVALVTYEVNGTTFESTVATSLLWSYSELTVGAHRTVNFTSIEITMENASMQFYGLSYVVQHREYNLTLYTSLIPLNSETYNTSFTIVNYVPSGKSETTSLEFVEFNSSVTLSQMYAVLGEVAIEVGKVYWKSGDETLAQLVWNYYRMGIEARYLSWLVKRQLKEYDREILESSAVLNDAYELCGVCKLACQVGIYGGCALACFLYPVVCFYCAVLVWYYNYVGLSCTAACSLLGLCAVLPSGVEIYRAEGTLSGTGDSYTFSLTLTGTYTVVMVGNEQADFDLYAKWGSAPTTSNYDAIGYSIHSSEYFTVSGGLGTLYIMVRSWSGSGNWRCNVVYGSPSASGGRKYGTLSGTGQTATYSLAGGGCAWVYLAGPDGNDFDLYAKWNSPPTTSSYDARGYSGWAHEVITCEGSGTLYYMVRSFRGSGEYTAVAMIF